MKRPPIAARPGLAALVALHGVAGAAFMGAGAAIKRRGDEADASLIWPAGLLGARHLVESAVLRRHHSRGWVLACASVDAAHSASMLLAAALWRPRRALLLACAAEASCFAGLAAAIALGRGGGCRCAAQPERLAGEPLR